MTKIKATSALLEDIIAQCEGDGDITIGEFVSLLGDRAFALAILVFALPNSLPIPGIPGFSTITGLPITFLACQMALGRQVLWLPKKVANKSFSKTTMVKVIGKTIPYIKKFEKLLHPRLDILVSDLAERLIALMFIVLSLIIALPIPGGNFIPGLSMSLLALSLLAKDGLAVALSLCFATAGIWFMVGIIKLFFTTMSKWFAKAF